MMWSAVLPFRCSRIAMRSIAAKATPTVSAFLRYNGGSSTVHPLFSVKRSFSSKSGALIRKTDKKSKSKEENTGVVGDLTNCETGIVIERLGDRLLVEYPLNIPFQQRSRTVCMQRAQFLQNQQHIVPGDYVHFRPLAASAAAASTNNVSENALTGMVEGFYTRKNTLERPSASSTKKKITIKPIASNIDQLVVVVAVEPLVRLHTLDRYIVSAHVHKIPEVHFVVNKADLPETMALYKRLSHYEKLGHRLILASTYDSGSDGLQSVRDILKGKISVVVGQSGVGKSSLINALIPSADLVVGDLVANNMYGAHTTSNARLYHIPAPSSQVIQPPLETSIPTGGKTVTASDSQAQETNDESDNSDDDEEDECGDIEDDEEDNDNSNSSGGKNTVVLPQLNEDGSWGRIVDSPGIRELGIWHLDRRTIQNGFKEIMHHARDCKFRNCAHSLDDAKHCGVWKAMKAGDIHPARYAHFIAIRDQQHD